MRLVIQREHSVFIDGIELTGSIASGRVCDDCGASRLVHVEEFDALSCPDCNIWLDPACGEPGCPVCTGRPEKPLPFE